MNELPIYDPNDHHDLFVGLIGAGGQFLSDIPSAINNKLLIGVLGGPEYITYGGHVTSPGSIKTCVEDFYSQWKPDKPVVIWSPSSATTWQRVAHWYGLQSYGTPRDWFDLFYGPGMIPTMNERDGATLQFMCSAYGISAPDHIAQYPSAIQALWQKMKPK